MKFVVTTNASLVPNNNPIVMLDGTVPGYEFKDSDIHFDHHREGGHDIQLTEIPEEISVTDDVTFVTTQIDADACVAAAYIILLSQGRPRDDWYQRFKSIAYDCDHLGVPAKLSHLSEFAAKAVAAMKQTGFAIAEELKLPFNRREWTEAQKLSYASLAFERGTMWLVDAALGSKPYPGEFGESERYFQNLQRQVSEYSDRVSVIDKPKWRSTIINMNKGYLLFDGRGISEYVDPRVFIKISRQKFGDLSGFQPETITVRDRKDGLGLSYTIGVIPCCERLFTVEYCKFGIFAKLTAMERSIDPDWDKDGSGWGGRKTVGGSSWNAPSLLSPEQVAYAIDSTPRWLAPEKSWDGEKFWCDIQDIGDYQSSYDCPSAYNPTKEWEKKAFAWMRQHGTRAVPVWL